MKRIIANLLGASALFLTGTGAAYALPASLDAHTALATNRFTLKSKSGEIYSQAADVPVNLEAYKDALAGNGRATEKLLKKLKKKVSIGNAKIETRGSGKSIALRSKACHYNLHLAKTQQTAKGLLSTYKLEKALPKKCGADSPITATETIMLKARLINTSKGVYQLPVQSDGSSVSAVLATLAPSDGNDAGLFGYTYFIKYANGSSLNWGTAGVMSNKLALGKSHTTVSYLIAEAVGQGALNLSQANIHLGSPSLEAPTLKVMAPKPCNYQMFLDKPSVHHKENALSVDFEAPKLSGSCLKGKNPLSITMTIEPLNIDPDGTNKMIVEKRDVK
ncbi:hypothetical protein RF55_17711 [Lasius niger]|uniref:Uncharacterized protein n=1 Tax=Lasius niger TaxID=67767 RepID=A0A0J7MVF5_LASNI|nr:hypothetical protein RF55_17711 [Lasius niger]